MKVFAVIPARGGSKSIPRKNIRMFLGHPLIAYSIAAAKNSSLVDKIICSTDDEEISAIARSYGAETPFIRPSNIAKDTTTDLPVFEHLVSFYEGTLKDEDLLLHLRPTSPFRPTDLIDRGINKMNASPDADSVRSISPSSENPYKMWTMEGDVIRPLIMTDHHESYNLPRQLLPDTYWHNGLLDIVSVGCIRNKGSMSGSRIYPLLVPPDYAIDLDTEHEWRVAEKIVEATKLKWCRP